MSLDIIILYSGVRGKYFVEMSILVAKLPTKKNERKVNDLDQCC
jgi:hypothetical protein